MDIKCEKDEKKALIGSFFLNIITVKSVVFYFL